MLGLGIALATATVALISKKVVEKTYKEAERIQAQAEEMLNKAIQNFKNTHLISEAVLNRFRKLKKKIWKKTVLRFMKHFKKIKNIELNGSLNFDSIPPININSNNSLTYIETTCAKNEFTNIAIAGTGIGLIGGLATGLTVTAILSPITIILSIRDLAKAQKAVNEAKENLSTAIYESSAIENKITILEGVTELAEQYSKNIKIFTLIYFALLKQMVKIIRRKKKYIFSKYVDWNLFSPEEKHLVHITLNFTEILKHLLIQPLLDSNDEVNIDAKELLISAERDVQAIGTLYA